jgi:C4-dicarboxylate transporter, DctM subunit
MSALLAFGGVLALLVLGMPVAFALGTVAVLLLLAHTGDVMELRQLGIAAYKALDSFILVALPLYVLMGEAFAASRMSAALFNAIAAFTRHIRSGLGIATVLSCGFLAAASGSSMTNAVTLGRTTIPDLLARGYPRGLAAGLVASGGTLGILIPPSLAFIVYSALTDTSVRDLFLAGAIPGLLQIGLTIGYLTLSRRTPPPDPRVAWRPRIHALGKAGWALMLPVAVLGGIYSGFFSATEAAAVGAAYALAVIAIVERRARGQELVDLLGRAVMSTVSLLAIVVGSALLGHSMVILQIPQQITAAVAALDLPPIMILLGLFVVLTALGCFLDAISVTLIAVPIAFPVVQALGFDPVWFGVLLVINLELAMLTPPIGMNLFAIASVVQGLKVPEVARASLPFIFINLLSFALVLAFPGIATWLPAVAR